MDSLLCAAARINHGDINMNTRNITSSVATAVIAAIVIAVTLAPAMASQPPDEDSCTIMHPDIEITNSTADQHVSDATGAFQSAPLNPDFVAYQKSPLKTSGDHVCGYIPPPMDLSHLDDIPVKRLQAPGVLPISFDWRDSGNVTSVKNQASCGTCWTFGTTSVLESAVLIHEGAEYNFSEQSVALCVDRSWTYLYDGTDDPCNAGGNSFKASEVFIRKGSVLESCNPYNGSALNCGGSCVCDNCTPVTRVDGYRLVTNNGSEIDVIKNAVYSHGPVTMSFYWHSSGSHTDATWGTIYDYYPCPESANHLVSIIGWNDSVPHPAEHDGTGAWIVKNSWGTGWGNDGYFYLAYNSSCVQGIAYLEYKDPIPGEELLYWDEAGFVDAVGSGDSSAWMASVFTANQSGNLTHVDFWTTSNNAEYEIYVWDGYFGSELANQTGICPEYGYYSIPLSTPIPMDAGQQFTVGVNMTTPGYGYPIPVELNISGTVSPTIQNNVSFIRQNASDSWTDMADHGWNACLRARMASKLPCTHGDICVNPTGWWCNNGTFNTSGTPIQSAVGNANAGETIYVWNGSYSENVDIGTASLTLQGEGADVVTVNAASSGDHVFDVTANRVNISGFMATGATGPDSAGINLYNADHCNISDNNVTNNDDGIYLYTSSNNTLANNNASDNAFYGIYLESSSYNNLRNNTANDCSEGYGIHLYTSSNNTLANNTASNNYLGIYLEDSSNNTLTNNTMSGSAGNFGVYGSSLPLCLQNIDTSNLVDGKPIYYWVNQHNQQVPDDAGYVGVVNSTNITVRDLVLTNNTDGVLFAYTNNSRIENVTVSNNSWGIDLEYSHNNTLTNNTANSNYGYGVGFGDGISLYSSSNNTLTNNTASNNDCDGIDLYSSSNNTLANNNASNNVFYGVYLWASNNNTLASNTANSNSRGIYLTSSNDNTVTNTTLLDNNWDIYIKSTSSDFTNNTLSGTTISFTYSGDVSLKGANSPAADPSGRHNIGKFINATNQSADAWIFLNFSYSDSDVSALNESSLKVWKYNGTWYEDGWNGTRYLNTTANVVGVNITSFSVFAPMVPLPDITSYSPETPVSDEPNATRTFSITVDQTVNVTWYINGTIVQDTNTSVTTASYTNTSAALGVWNVSAVVSNANGTDMQTWIWNVALSGDVTGDDAVDIGDAVLLFNWVSFPNERETTYTLNRTDNADVTGNGVVNIGDATLLFNWVSFESGRGTTYVLK